MKRLTSLNKDELIEIIKDKKEELEGKDKVIEILKETIADLNEYYSKHCKPEGKIA